MTVRPDVVELLHAGYGDRGIARQLGLPWRTIAAARKELGLPRAPMGPKAAGSVEDLYWRRVQPAADGHLDWTGARTRHGTPVVRHGGRLHTALQVAFRIRYRRDPVGRVEAACKHKGCVRPQCMADQRMRDRDNTTYDAIFGGAA